MTNSKHRSTESIEDYLETILKLTNKLGQVRSIDIANELHYSKPSVSIAMKNLRSKNYITVNDNGYIHLTESGKELADKTLERHTLLSGWLISIGVSEEVAYEDACKIEHDLSEETYEAIKKYFSSVSHN
ncbi:MAG: metal-dependent transcriptional regulator [Lachnospiraceae bacterium]|nr:metal-dependent transcriptional regulator [Lachnospiraceae bacterium]